MKFSLLQLVVCIAIILFIAYVVLWGYNPKPAKIFIPQNPQISVPFQNIKIQMK